MNPDSATCDVCGGEAQQREWLRCMLCGNRFHFAPEDAAGTPDCGVVLPNPQSQGGC